MSSLPLSVLDLSIGCAGRPLSAALAETVHLARTADRLGYRRFWVGENHNIAGLASSAPAVLIADIARSTDRIRVGAGCVLLNNHAPLAVAETFRVLHALHPDRIDLGLGRAPGGDPRAASALRDRPPSARDEFVGRLADLFGFFYGLPPSHRYHGVVAMPADVPGPQLWVLGAGVQSGRTAALAGVRYGFAGHLAPSLDAAREPVAVYRRDFEPTGEVEQPHTALSVQVYCADTAERADGLADAYAVAWHRHQAGAPGFIPTVEQAQRVLGEPGVEAARDRFRAVARIGTPAEVVAGLKATMADLGADEIIMTTGINDPDERGHCFELIAKQWAASDPD